MARTLILLRHAKSDWHSGSAGDHERPLNPRGVRAAALIGVYLGQERMVPDLVLTSTAARAAETGDVVIRHGGFGVEPRRERALYLANPDHILGVLRTVPASFRCVLLVAHNPGMQELAAALAERTDRTLAAAIHEDFPTAALAAFETAQPWSDVEPDALTLERFVLPKSLI